MYIDSKTVQKYNYKLAIAYDGSDYCGWQRQPNGPSIQGQLENCIGSIIREKVCLYGSGRTDAGVHARRQIAHFSCSSHLPLDRFRYSLNALLPKDIRVIDVEAVPLTFHARFSALSKIYHYHLWLDPIRIPFNRNFCWQPRAKVDLSSLTRAAQLFIGTRDFTTFANRRERNDQHCSSIRTLSRLDVVAEEGGVRLEFQADGFLYKMVRNITGTLVEAAAGKLPIEEIEYLLNAKDRRVAGQAAPPHGLFLIDVIYL